MNSSGGYQAYQNSAVLTASPEQLVVMLYDGCLRFLRRAESAAVEGNRVGVATASSRANAIIAELNSTLDLERGGEIAENLRSLYGFLSRHIAEASVSCQPDEFAAAIQIVDGLRDAFAQAAQQAEQLPDAGGPGAA